MKTATVTLENEFSIYASDPWNPFKRCMAAARQTLRTWAGRARTRRSLRDLSLRMLEDIGVEPGDAMAEANKPFWRA